MSRIYPVTIPKWGLSMKEGKVNRWLAKIGDSIQAGAEIVEVESDKIAGVIEANSGGVLWRQVAKEGDVLPVDVESPHDVVAVDRLVVRLQRSVLS